MRRIQQLLVTSLWKFSADRDSSCEMFNEAATTMEKLAVLMAWAEVCCIYWLGFVAVLPDFTA